MEMDFALEMWTMTLLELVCYMSLLTFCFCRVFMDDCRMILGFMVDKIVTGSLNGYIRVYHVHSAGFQIDDLMLEQNLELPILQVLCGKFIQYLVVVIV